MQPYIKFVFVSAGLLCLAQPCFSFAADLHPAYLHALEDLKIAQADILTRGGDKAMSQHEHNAVLHTKDAQWLISSFLAPDDKKNAAVLPAADTDPSKAAGGLHDAKLYLEKALSDCNEAESNEKAVSTQHREVSEIKAALYEVNLAIADFGQHR